MPDIPVFPPGFTLPHTPCATCKVGQIYMGRFKNCASCRDKNREKSRLAAQRKAQRASLAGYSIPSPSYDDDPMLDIPPPAAIQKKTPATKPFRDLGNDEKRLALAHMKNTLPTRVREKKSASPMGMPSSKAQDGKEYQTAQEMYASITRRMTKLIGTQKMLNFKGHFAIVADESITNEKRVLLVSSYLHGMEVPFERTQAKGKYNADRTARTLQFECACLGYEKVAPVMKGNAGDLIKKARLSLGKTTSKPRICGGKVSVTAAVDTTHPLDVLGQRITVHVEH